MTFESIWPLFLLLCVPVVIIFYLLIPKGKDERISSNILWEKLFKNRQSKTFFEKFIHNLLMYLQILILLVLVIALMSPYIQTNGTSSGSVVFVLDVSGSMQHKNASGETRLEEAISEIKGYMESADNGTFSLVTNDGTGTALLAVGTSDKSAIARILDQVSCTDTEGDLSDALSAAESIGADAVVVVTDGIGAADADDFKKLDGAIICVVGEACANVANTFLSVAASDDEAADTLVVAAGLTNYSDTEATFEISLFDGDDLISVRALTIPADESYTCLFEDVQSENGIFRTEISNITFLGSDQKDSLAADNTAYGLAETAAQVDAVLFSDGNTYIEKAYLAVTGQTLSKTTDEAAALGGDAIVIYDADTAIFKQEDKSSLAFGDETYAGETLKNVSLSATETDITSGIGSFAIGVNATYTYDLPTWATGFLWSGEKCAGYYGEHDGVRQVVLGFDIRESDFALQAEYPVFMANALFFLADSSLLSQNVYEAGERVLVFAQSDVDVTAIETETAYAGLYTAAAGEKSENYVVRFATGSQSDGRITAESVGENVSYRSALVKKQLRTALLIAAIFLLFAEWILYVRQMRYRGRFYLAVRAVLLLAIALSVFGVTIPKAGASDTTIFLVDLSESNASNLTEMESYLKSCIEKMPDNNRYGIVAFGKTSVVEEFLTDEKHFSSILSAPDATATNLEEAVTRGLSMIPENAAGRLVFLTDGRQTKGNIANTASAVVTSGAELLSLVYETSQEKDAYIEDVTLPSYLYQGDSYSMTVTVESNYETDADLLIITGSRLTGTTQVHLLKGSNQFVLKQTVTGESAESFSVRVVADGDTCEENNTYSAYAVVDSLPRVLVISGMNEDSSAFIKTLTAAGINYQVVSAKNAPGTLDDMLSYRSIILENVYRTDLPEGFLANIETYVQDYGCGLICCGGKESFALGGYRDTELETVLPVDMDLRGQNELPSLAMVMVIDHSGSMSADAGDGSGATNLDLAIAAAEAALDELRDDDYVGVLTFDDTYTWQVKIVQASDRDTIKKRIENIPDGGGTTIKPALFEALDKIKNCTADVKHVVLLTDGEGETSYFDDLTSSYRDAGVTLSTVAVGYDSDTALLEKLANACGGRYYYSDIASDIPKIFAQEVLLSGDTYLQNGTFSLAVNESHAITQGLYADGYPNILGYVSATQKSSATVLIASEKDDPILTVMQCGLGHTVAWNTDVTNQWSGPLAASDDYVSLWKRIIDYSAGNGSLGEDTVDVTTAGGFAQVTYRAKDYTESTAVEAVYTDPDGDTQTVKLTASAPGVYEARIDTDTVGIYNLSVRRKEGGETTNSVTTAALVQYSDEYKFALKSDAYTAFIAQYGTQITPEDDIWKKLPAASSSRVELAKWLIMFAILWFVLDIGFRRFCFVPPAPHFRKLRMPKKRESAQPGPAQEKPARPNAAQSAPAERVHPMPQSDRKDAAPRKQKAKKQKSESASLDTSALLHKKSRR